MSPGHSDAPWRRYLTFWRANVDRDVDSELRFHFEERVADLVARGRTPSEARAEAEQEFGDTAEYRARLREIDHRIHARRHRTQWLEVVATDVRYALRGMRRSPALAATVVTILALGVGANATMFGLIDRLLFRAPDHITDPDRVVLLQVRKPADSWTQTTQPYVFRTVMENAVSGFAGVAVATPTGIVRRQYFPVGRGVSASRVAGALVSSNYFSVLGVRPVTGRLFDPSADTAIVPERAAVLGYGYWQRQYAGSADAIGKSIQVGTASFTIIGVLPAGFTGTEMRDVDVWMPIDAAPGLRFAGGSDWKTSQNWQWLLVIARVKDGVDPRRAEAEATLALRNWSRSRLKTQTPARLASIDSLQVRFSSMIPGKSNWDWGMSGSSSDVKITKLLAAASAMLLLMACANITNLLLVRALSRRREIAVRLSLGVSRARLITQLVVEGFTLALFGVVGALAVAAVGSQYVRRWLIGEGAFSGGFIDARVLGFTLAVGLATGVVAALLPALQVSRADLSASLKSGARMGSPFGSRLRDGLLIAQGAVAVLLLAGATLFIRSLRNAQALDVGVEVNRVAMARIDQGTTGLKPGEVRLLFDEFVRRAEAMPGIRSAALTSPIPFGGSWSTSIHLPGRTLPGSFPTTFQYFVTPRYFETVGIRVRAGRVFSAGDEAGTAVVINETLAGLLWPRANAIGKCIKVDADTMPCATVIGVVTDTRRQDLVESGFVPQIYRPIPRPGSREAGNFAFMGFTLVARSEGDAAHQVEPLRRTLQGVSSSVPYAHVQTMRDLLGRHTRNWQLGAKVFTAFGALALILAAVGLFSVVAFTVGQRMYEFGVRTALGARPRDLARLTIARGLTPALGGIVLGVVLVLALGRFLDGLLFQQSTRDPAAFGMATGILFVSAALASLLPAMRASRADPKVALNSE